MALIYQKILNNALSYLVLASMVVEDHPWDHPSHRDHQGHQVPNLGDQEGDHVDQNFLFLGSLNIT
jgi:hypothetical protein